MNADQGQEAMHLDPPGRVMDCPDDDANAFEDTKYTMNFLLMPSILKLKHNTFSII